MTEKEKVKLREAKNSDLELIMAWRSHPKIYQYFYHQDSPLDWKEHVDFWKSRENRKDWIILYKQGSNWRKVGTANVSELNTRCPEIGVLIGEITLWGEGVGTLAVSRVIDWLNENSFTEVKAGISKENTASKKLFKRLGFKQSKELTSRNEWLYKKSLTG